MHIENSTRSHSAQHTDKISERMSSPPMTPRRKHTVDDMRSVFKEDASGMGGAVESFITCRLIVHGMQCPTAALTKSSKS